MAGDADDTGNSLYEVCHRVVQHLMRQYEWTLTSEDELVALLLESVPEDTSPSRLRPLAIGQYASVMYTACAQREDFARREQGYRELFRFVYRTAYRRWSDLGEERIQDMANRALAMVFEKIDHCQEPVAFLSFASYKLLYAVKLVLGESPHAIDDPYGEQAPPADLIGEEATRVLLDALQRLSNVRQREAVFLHFFEILSDLEISIRLNTSTGNVRVLRTRGMSELRKDPVLRDYFAEYVERDRK